MQRRELVRTGLFGVAAAAAGAAHAAQDAAPAKKRLSENWDVVVVGAGFAGMCAALEAAEQGAKTVLLEKMNRPDGATVYCCRWEPLSEKPPGRLSESLLRRHDAALASAL